MIFQIQGVITTRKDLDREAPGLAVDADERGVYTLLVEATDHGSPAQRTTATVNINQLCFFFSERRVRIEMLIDVRAKSDCGPVF